MSGDYISRKAAMPDGFCVGVSCQECPFCDDPIKGGCKVARFIDAIPAADVVEVRHGRWKPRDLTWGRSYYYCTICEETVDMPTAMGIPMFKYCPSCGAKMDGGQDDV